MGALAMIWRYRDPTQWRRWFAWRPVLADHGDTLVWVWWQWVERRMPECSHSNLAWDYRVS
jgi:hypothetical protein